MSLYAVVTIAVIVIAWVVAVVAGIFTLMALWAYARTMSSRKAAIRGLFYGSFVLLVAGCLAYAAWNNLTSRALNAQLTAIRDRGEPVAFEDIAPRPVASGESDAAPLYAVAMELLQASNEAPGLLSRPLHQSLEAGAWPPDEEQLADAKRLLDSQRLTLDLLERAAAIDLCRFDLKPQFGIGAFLNRTDASIALAQLTQLQFLVSLAVGNTDKAVVAIESMARIPRIFDANGMLIHELVRVAIVHLLANQVPILLQHGQLSDEQLVKLSEMLAGLDQPGRLADSLRNERVYVLGAMGLVQGQTPLPGNWHELMAKTPVMKQMTLEQLRVHGEAIAACDKPLHEMATALKQIHTDGPFDIFAATLLPSLERAAVLNAQSAAMARAARLGIECERYRRAHGVLPDSLDQLVPKFIEKIPSDPFDGKAIRYVRNDNQAIIYSLGENLEDEGGAIEEGESGRDRLDFGLRFRVARK